MKNKNVVIIIAIILCIVFLVGMRKTANDANSEADNGIKIIGYWENYVDSNYYKPLKLKEVSELYDVINIAFARASKSNDGKVEFALNEYLCKTVNYSKEEFKQDIKEMQKKNKKILISIGGESGGEFKLTNTNEVENFVTSTKAIIDEYGFDGIDIDIESGNVDIEYCKKALTEIYDTYDGNKLLTINSSLTDMKTADVNDGVDNVWYQISRDLKDKIWLVSSRYYNSGTQSGYDFPTVYSREQGHISFITSIAVKQLEDAKLNNNNIGISILATESPITTLPQAYMEPKDIVKALSSIIEGINPKSDYKNFVPPSAHPELKAVTIWSINKDAYHDYRMAKEISKYFEK